MYVMYVISKRSGDQNRDQKLGWWVSKFHTYETGHPRPCHLRAWRIFVDLHLPLVHIQPDEPQTPFFHTVFPVGLLGGKMT